MTKKLRNRLAEILKEKDITPYRLAIILDKPAPTIYSWVNNRTNPSNDNLIKICDILAINIDDFYEVYYE